MDERFEEKLFKEIKEKEIKPRARWSFAAREYAIWALGALSLIIGAAAFAVIIYLVGNNDWELYREFSGSIWEFVLLTLPYFWIIFLSLFVIAVSYEIRHTKRGYRISLPFMAMGSVLISVFLGILFHQAGLGRLIDDVLGKSLPVFGEMMNPGVRIWDDPSHGRLLGLVVSKEAEGRYRLVDIDKEEWLIDMSGAELSRGQSIELGRPIKLLGSTSDGSIFMVERILRHDGPGRMMMHRLREEFPMPPLGGDFPAHCAIQLSASGTDAGVCPMMMPPR